MASAESIRKNALFCDDMHVIDKRSVTLKSFDATVYEGKVRARVSLCIRSSDTVSICSVCMLKQVKRKSWQIVDSLWGDTKDTENIHSETDHY